MKLNYTPQALAELDGILSEIAASSPRAAERVGRRLQGAIDRFLDFPESGQPTQVSGLRRFVVKPYPYVIFYLHHADADEIVVVAYRHAAADPASMPG